MSDRVEQSKKNIVWSVVGKVINLILPFASQTCLIYVLGVQYVGLNGIFSSVLMLLGLSELGIGSALVFSMYKPIANGDDARVCALLAFYRKCYFVIGGVILTAGILLLPFIDKMISGDVPDDINIYAIYLICLFNTVISYFLFAHKTSLLNACQKVDMISTVDIVTNSIKSILQMAALLVVSSYYAFILVLPVTTILRSLCINHLTLRKYPQYFCRGKLLPEDIRVIKEKVKGLVFFNIGGVVLISVDNIVVSIFLGLVVLGKYNSYMYIINSLIGLVEVILSAIVPVIGNSIVLENKEKNYKNFNQFDQLWQCMITWCSVCLLCLQQPFIKLWAGDKVLLSDGMAILFVLYFYARKTSSMVWTYKSAGGIWKEGRYVPIVSSLVNLSLNLMLVNIIGLPGIVLSSVLSLLFINIPFGAKVLFDVYFNYQQAWKSYMVNQVKNLVITVFICAVTYAVCVFCIPFYGFGGLLLRAAVCLSLGTSLIWAFFRKNPRLEGIGWLWQRLLHK